MLEKIRKRRRDIAYGFLNELLSLFVSLGDYQEDGTDDADVWRGEDW